MLQKLNEKGVIEESVHEEGEIISHVFIRPNSNGLIDLYKTLAVWMITYRKFILRWKHLKMHCSKWHKDITFGKLT